MTDQWNGKGRTSADPYILTTDRELTFVDIYGREYTIPAGATIRQFETTNMGWNVWRDSDGKQRVRDCG